ncbi:Pdgfc [Phodopus roborovskii]|uniref:Pdgfc protein n=1 Tax=Phodopus roborovskii TaxID=109678 RepID=A0AAU9ZUP9_PHORO|nr:Pdgfc [Phodopus roborovskii]
MLLLGLLLLTSALAGLRTGTRAESNLSSKLQLSSDKEQNDSFVNRNFILHMKPQC